MLRKPPATDSKKADTDSPVSAALKCAYHFIEQRIISNPKDMIGVLLFGTEKSKFQEDGNGRPGLGYPHCYLYQDLDIPSADDVKKLKALVEEDDDEDDVLKSSKERASMANVLFCANQIFTTRAANFGSRRLFIVTDDEDPHANDKAAKSAAAVRAKDLYDLGVTIELFPITYGDSSFDVSKFYDVSNPWSTASSQTNSVGYCLPRLNRRSKRIRSAHIKIWRWANSTEFPYPKCELKTGYQTSSLLKSSDGNSAWVENIREGLQYFASSSSGANLLHMAGRG